MFNRATLDKFTKDIRHKLEETDLGKEVVRHVDNLPKNLDRLQETVKTSFNPNHRHDEEYEKEQDRLQKEIASRHRFQSFAKERDGNNVKWYIDGHDYFWAISELLERATECIWILDWWLTPELYLRRPPAEHEEWRLDRILKRKADQGVKIYIIVYKEVTQTMTMSSSHTKHHLEDLHPNIAVMRHPDHIGGEVTLYWSHHEKLVVVDNVYAAVGGLDLCFGRWDTHTFPLADVHPTDFDATLFAGQDYNNARVQDFQKVENWASNQQSRLEVARMPWHDVHMTLVGPVVLDLSQHFVERWNFIRAQKYAKDYRYDHLDFPHVFDTDANGEEEPITLHPHLHKFKELGKKYLVHSQDPHNYHPKGGIKAQLVRSSADWSHGILTEHSIQNAYKAKHCVYIENQFFITNTRVEGPVKNQVGSALAGRIITAAARGEKFKVVILIPCVPGFAGALNDTATSAGTLAIMKATYESISRGPGSIMGLIQKAGFNPNDYISFYNLRSYDRINHDPKLIEQQEQASGISFQQAQAALARLYVGEVPPKDEGQKNAVLTFVLPPESETLQKEAKGQAPKTVDVPLPHTVSEAKEIIAKFENAAPRSDKRVSDSVAHHAMKSGGSLLDEAWEGDQQSELNAFLTEELYIHCKLLIIDDRKVLMGSANLNDRSLCGDHDSEIALVVEDGDEVDSLMDGQPYRATRFAATLRRELWKHHLGLSPPQFCPPHEQEPITPAMKPVGTPHVDVTGSEEDKMVMDPLSDSLEQLWKGTAKNNADIFGKVFHCVPAPHIRTWDQYSAFVPPPPQKVGHVYSLDQDVRSVKEQLSEVRGHLVAMPLDFLEGVQMDKDVTVNPITLPLFL